MDIRKWKPVTCLVTGRRWNSTQFGSEISARVKYLEAVGLKSGDLVFLAHNNSLEFLADLFALWALGARAAALSPGLTRSEIENLVGFAAPKALLTGPEGRPALKGLSLPLLDLAKEKKSLKGKVIFSKDFELILFTSGTTGDPKGVVHSRAGIEAKIETNLGRFGKTVFENSLCLLSTQFVAGLFSNILTPLEAGGRVFLYPDPGIKGAGQVGEIIDRQEITFINSVPSLWNLILKTSKQPTASKIKLISVVSAPLNNQLRKAIKAWSGAEEVLSLYGTTETGGWNTNGEPGFMKEGSVGHILGGEAALLDENGKIVKHGKGELLIKSKAVMSQYLNRPDLNRKAFIDGWFKTGDLADIDKTGNIFITGRLKGQINRAGIKIVPEEIEALLETHPDVEAACVFGYPDPVMGEGVAAAIELTKGAEENFPAIRNWCKPRTRAVTIPEKWFRVNAMPRTARGKIDRKKIREGYFQKGGF